MAFSPVDIVTQLHKYLPRVTSLFSTIVTPESASIVAGSPQKLSINIPGHRLKNGNQITVFGSLINNPITAVSQYTASDTTTNILRFTVAAPHDITVGYTAFINLSGFADAGLNSQWTELYIPDRYHFDIAYPTLPTLTGNEVMQQSLEIGIDGIWPVTVVDKDNITITLTDSIYMEAGLVPQLSVSLKNRITWVRDFKTVQEMYTKEPPDNNWLFLVMEDCRLSKSVNVPDDATAKNSAGTQQRLSMINLFSLDVIIPTKDDIGGSNAVQLCWSDLLLAMIHIMSGVSFDPTLNSNYTTVLKGHSALVYNRAYYGHGYTFEYVYELDNDDIFSSKYITSVNLEGFNQSFLPPSDTGSNFNLDIGGNE